MLMPAAGTSTKSDERRRAVVAAAIDCFAQRGFYGTTTHEIAEWVGISSRVDSGDAIIRFVPGGLAHALDPSLNRVLCGTDPDQLEAFAIDFTNDEWSFRCPECRRLAEAEERGQ